MLSQGEGCRKDVGEVGCKHVKGTINYSTWPRTLSDRNVFCTLRGKGKTAGSNAPGAFLVLLLLPRREDGV